MLAVGGQITKEKGQAQEEYQKKKETHGESIVLKYQRRRIKKKKKKKEEEEEEVQLPELLRRRHSQGQAPQLGNGAAVRHHGAARKRGVDLEVGGVLELR